MASEFDFLRMKWPKLAAMAADASRLADISPSSSVSSLRTYCEWASDIALDLYEIQVGGGASQIEKLEALQASGLVPAEVLQKFHNVRSAGNRTMQEMSSATDLVHACISDCRDIGQWLFREAEKEGWPRAEGYAPSYGRVPIEGLNNSPQGLDYEEGGGGFRMSKFMRRYGSFVTMGLAAVVVIGLIAAIAIGFGKCSGNNPQNTQLMLSPTVAPITPAPTPGVAATPTPAPTEEPEPFVWMDEIPISQNFSCESLYLRQWDIKTRHQKFFMNDVEYEHGIGMFIPRDAMEKRASQEAVWQVNGDYYKCTFDLGVDQKFGYDIRQKYGVFQVRLYADGVKIWDSQEKQDYLYFKADNVVQIPAGTQMLKVRLDQYKGEKGTLNIIMGNFKLYENPKTEE